MTSYVLVHGAWGGAHNFRHVRPVLRAAGHEVTTPCLTGLGERAHLTGPHIDLTTHVRDVVNHILYEDLSDIVLMGFSYGGMVVTGALEHIAERVRHLVYLDAFVPRDGESVNSMMGGQRRPMTLGEPWAIPPAARGYADPAEAAFSAQRRADQPGLTFAEPVRLLKPLEDYPFTRTYIRATGDPPDAMGSMVFQTMADRCRASKAWTVHEIASTHVVPVEKPKELVELLLMLA
jgi:pimeloyl-ACP methyl ester carboxylesterase